MDDGVLFERVTRDDAKALGIIMHRYATALYSFAYRIVGETLAAEDIVQEIFINLWVKRRNLKPGPSLRNFLYLSVRNLALNHIRRQKVRLAYAENYRLEQTMDLMVIEEEKYRLLSEAINQLPPRTADVIKYSCEGMSQEEIAQKMEITIATVKLLKSKGIKRLKEILGPLAFLICF
ncbi:RNA polymerase sigma factor [Butyricimonas virosa]|uniref:RNA polymerase sigma factor n=1 Tax=Butyricimonas virosa TaxID=544645 RepID=UPI00242B0F65|nr:sigma-70 family RNA polymerase sigma factor [Butyricimonas virosa]